MKSILLYSLLVVLEVSFSSGCRKKKDTTAKITVRDATNSLVIGATVRVYAVSSTNPHPPVTVDDTQTSDYKGEANFNYNNIYQLGQAGVAVLNIDASKGTATGSGIIKIQAETENTQTVYIQ